MYRIVCSLSSEPHMLISQKDAQKVQSKGTVVLCLTGLN